MTTTGRVLSVDPVTAKNTGEAWRVITDYAVTDADGLTRCAFWLRRPGPVPEIGEEVSWGASLFNGPWAFWPSHPLRVRRLENDFDPNDPALYTG